MRVSNGALDTFKFGERSYAGEPIFVPKPGGRIDQGWLLSQVLDGDARVSRLEIFDAEQIPAGPLASVGLEHHVPISFHGWWQGTSAV